MFGNEMFAQHVFFGDLLVAALCKGDGSERGGEILPLEEAGMGPVNCWTPALSTGLGTEEVPSQLLCEQTHEPSPVDNNMPNIIPILPSTNRGFTPCSQRWIETS